MKCNEGSTDRIIRAIAGVAIIGAGYYYQSWWGAIGLVPLVTAVIGWCPAYALLGLKTCKLPQSD